MTHMIVKDGRLVVVSGGLLTSAGGALCCCDGGTTDCNQRIINAVFLDVNRFLFSGTVVTSIERSNGSTSNIRRDFSVEIEPFAMHFGVVPMDNGPWSGPQRPVSLINPQNEVVVLRGCNESFMNMLGGFPGDASGVIQWEGSASVTKYPLFVSAMNILVEKGPIKTDGTRLQRILGVQLHLQTCNRGLLQRIYFEFFTERSEGVVDISTSGDQDDAYNSIGVEGTIPLVCGDLSITNADLSSRQVIIRPDFVLPDTLQIEPILNIQLNGTAPNVFPYLLSSTQFSQLVYRDSSFQFDNVEFFQTGIQTTTHESSVSLDFSAVVSSPDGIPSTCVPRIGSENEPCDLPDQWPVARECDGDERVTFDPALRPPDGVTFISGGIRYIPIDETSRNNPAPGEWSPDPCPVSDTIYRINRCNSTQPARWFDIVGGLPVERTVGYRPGNGLSAGQGHVRVVTQAATGCLFSLPSQPTAVEWDTEPEVVLTSVPGQCGAFPSVLVDPRPQCQPVDGGGGGGPTGDNNITTPGATTLNPTISAAEERATPGLGDAIAEAIRVVTLNRIVPCSACERRKQILNKFGDRLGRAVIRKLGW